MDYLCPMRELIRLLSYARPVGRYLLPYGLFSLLTVLFGLVNFALIIPLLNVLFRTSDAAGPVPTDAPPPFAVEADYPVALFNHYFYTTLRAQGPFRTLLFVAGVIVVSVLLTNVFRYLSSRIEEGLRAHNVRQLRWAVFERTTALHLGYFTNERKGDLLSRITTDVQEVESSVTRALTVVVKEPITIVGYFVLLFTISGRLTLFSLLIIPVSGLLISTVVRRLRKDARAGQESLSRLVSIVDETLGGLRIVKGFNATGYVNRKFAAENDHYARIVRRMAYRRELASPLSEFMGVALVAGILVYGGSLVLGANAPLSPSAFVAYLALFSQVQRPAKSLTTAFSNIQRGLAAGQRVLALIDTPPAVQDRPGARALAPFAEAITFNDVSFAYGDTPVLRGISFRLPKGGVVALVGPSGGGKSTIADLLPRFYDPDGGRVCIDGTDLRTLSQTSVRAQMGIVSQESILFNDTIFNNIAFGMPDATAADVEAAARVANAHEFISQTTGGYQTVIGDRGTRLSGGQRQRLSIARAVLHNPPILILDEATSALDNASEKLVQEALFHLMQNRTTLVIAHRLSTIQHADEILVIDRGQICERGTHAELQARPDGLYRRLSELQTG